MQTAIKGEREKITGTINEPPRRQVSQRDELYNRPLTQVQHRYPTRLSKQVNNIEQEKIKHVHTSEKIDPERVSSTTTRQPAPPEADKVETARIQREREQRERGIAIQQIYMNQKYGRPITNVRAKTMMYTPRKVKKKGGVEKRQEEPPDLIKELDKVRVDLDKTFDGSISRKD